MKKITALLLSAIISFTTISPAFASTATIAKNQRFSNVMKQIVASWESNRTISAIKDATDFAGNKYTIIECTPKGYLIYNNDAALIMESSEDSYSPYLGLTGQLYYGGPTCYYSVDTTTGSHTHTVLGTSLTESEVDFSVSKCQEAQKTLLLNSNTLLKSYLETGIQNDYIASLSVNSTNTYVGNHRDFFENMDLASEMSYWDDPEDEGICGYIAASIMLLYYHNYYNSNYIDTGTYPLITTLTGKYYTGPLFSYMLYTDIGIETLGYGKALSAVHVASVMKTYLSEKRNISINTSFLTAPILPSAVTAQLNVNRPLVYVDEWNNPVPNTVPETLNHDIVVYGYDSNNNFIAHFGWEGYAHVVASQAALSAFFATACYIY